MNIQLIILLLSCTLVSAVLAFFGGMVFEKWWTVWSLERAAKKVNKAVEQLVNSLNTAQKLSEKVAAFPGNPLETRQIDEVNRHRQQLDAALNGLLSSYLKPSSGLVEKEAKVAPVWCKSPRDFHTDLPDYAACMENLKILSEHIKTQGEGSILLLQMDRFDDLGKRYGNSARVTLLRNMSQLVIRNMREADLLCHLHDDMFLLMMPWVKDDQQAIAIRDTLKGHRFYLDKSRDEVIVSTNLGLYTMSAGDTPQLALERATTALMDSRKKGRNQLMQHNGRCTQLCRAS